MKDWTLAWIGAGALGVSAWTCDPMLLADEDLARRFARTLEASCRRSGVPLLAVSVLPGSVHALLGRGGRVLPTIPFGLAKAAVTRTSSFSRTWRSRVRVLPIAASRIPDLVDRLATTGVLASCRDRQTRVSEA
jgi:hypothetical protein